MEKISQIMTIGVITILSMALTIINLAPVAHGVPIEPYNSVVDSLFIGFGILSTAWFLTFTPPRVPVMALVNFCVCFLLWFGSFILSWWIRIFYPLPVVGSNHPPSFIGLSLAAVWLILIIMMWKTYPRTVKQESTGTTPLSA